MGSERLRGALDAHLTGVPAASLGAAVDDLVATYRSPRLPDRVVLSGDRQVAAYAAYRMPATYTAVAAALGQLRAALPSFAPESVVDAGAGTGAASWAVAEVYGVTRMTLLEQSAPAIAVGRALAASGEPALRDAEWREWRMAADPLPECDLLVCAYVLGEVDDATRESFVARAAAAARRSLLDLGMRLVAPCPHEAECPLAGTGDWCHFAARVERSALHRRLKQGQLGWEDEKFSFVAVARDGVPDRPGARVLRHPQVRKGLVSLSLCAGDGTARQEVVSKRQGERYRAARKVEWGDRWAEEGGAPAAKTTPPDSPR